VFHGYFEPVPTIWSHSANPRTSISQVRRQRQRDQSPLLSTMWRASGLHFMNISLRATSKWEKKCSSKRVQRRPNSSFASCRSCDATLVIETSCDEMLVIETSKCWYHVINSLLTRARARARTSEKHEKCTYEADVLFLWNAYYLILTSLRYS
jgi:hypothetical protein